MRQGQRISAGKAVQAQVSSQHESTHTGKCDSEAVAPIDFDHLNRQTFGDEKLAREVLELFLVHAPALLAEIKSATNEASRRAAAHKLKGMARAIGAWAVANAAEDVERAAKDLGEASAITERLEKAIEEARRLIAGLERNGERGGG